MSRVDRLLLGLANPNLVVRKANHAYHSRLWSREYNTAGVDVFSEDWDVLVVLDACRYDMFEELCELPGDLSRRVSRGSSTTEFLGGNFRGDLTDTVYLTANPQLYRYRDRYEVTLHEVVDVWRDEWNEEAGTVLPETVTERAIDAAGRFQDKRLVVHYIQPHYPFIDADTSFDEGQIEDPDGRPSFWQRIMRGELDVPVRTIWDAYERNLERVLDSVEALLTSVEGRTVVTSDHGNMVGERAFPIPIREWGHPAGQYVSSLVDVPWLVRPSDTRRKVTAEAPETDAEGADGGAGEDIVADRLQQLGYVE